MRPGLVRMLWGLVRSLRPRQWTKNAFIFTALVFDRKLTDVVALQRTLLGFGLFCLLSGAVYLLNDIMDREADARHPKKRLRPIPSGELPVSVAWAAAVGLPLVLLPLAFALSTGFGLVATTYYVTMVLYTFWWKHIPIIDVFTIAAGFVLRVVAGLTLFPVARFSPWLYVVTMMLSLFIGFGKRRAEIVLLKEKANAHRRVLEGYTLAFLDQLITVTATGTLLAYSLYTFSAPNLPPNHAMMLTIPVVVYGIARYLYLVYVMGWGGAPEEALLADRPLQFAVLLWGAMVLGVFYWPYGG